MTDKKNSETINLSGTEDLLLNDKSGEYREQLLKQLMDEAFRLKTLVDQGIAPNEFEKNTSMMLALLAAADVVDHTWEKHHKQPSG
ncbi:EscE/YscE/SsaE family type III secretion system needle protein co-chaperone [Endozoicomonas gorgoniicola]|uniref:EscE/YscE/SsaE family type III secretion system needle protein co-chaperone n=1 Tax=Endozoicomonas gorgoniicola TaxID=1234144 RepID=A0ABT3MRC6_9GAMM|nr:EscE/YscE/SsaE family type III secretion system needle protein co-chaperone [Endozoicomonas gorgoniicola]MCW7551918.1 EscE/YscE/SsaE family type III secretion system needle protein co-chaperone [Endozoicomonas gorgoniicola]